MISNYLKQIYSSFRVKNLIYVPQYVFSQKLTVAHTIGRPASNLITMSLGQLFTRMVQKHPSNILLNSYDQNITMTYQEAYHKALSLSYGMIDKLGLKPKDRIGIYSYNKWQWLIIQLAAAMADLILVNINPAYQAEELAYTIQKVNLKVLFLSDSFKNSNYLNIMKRIIPEIEMINQGRQYDINSKRFPFLKALVRFNQQQQRQKGFINFTDLLIQQSQSNIRKYLPKHPSCYQPTNIQFTSGTTGLPKAATLTHYNILNNGYQIGNRLNYTFQDNIVLPVPFYHCFGMVMGNLAAVTRGAGITIVSQGFDPKKSLQAASKYKSTSIYGVPTMFLQYLRVLEQYKQNNKFNLKTLRTGIIAGSLAPQPLMMKIIDKLGLVDITNCYGMTQTSPVSFQTANTDTMLKKTTSVGRILDGLQGKIINQNGQTCAINQPGEFITKGWHIMKQYWGDSNATQKSIIDGWMKSGDMGVIDEDGYLSIVGRKKDMIIRGGQNVYPKQIQQYLLKLQGIQDVQVIGVSDQKFGEQIAAIIKVKNIQHNIITKHKIFNYCKGNIAHYKIPKYVKFVTQLPLTVTGKIQKYIMRQQFEQEIKLNKHKDYMIR